MTRKSVAVLGECVPDCGGCCNPVVLAVSPVQAQTWNPTDDDERADRRFIIEDLTPLSMKEGLRRAPHMAAARERGVVSSSPNGSATSFWFYECRHYDAETRRCTDYEHRPPVCRRFPWGVTGPQSGAILPFGCGYLADIPEDARHPMYRGDL